MSAAHVHPNPGYEDYASWLRGAATNPELLSSKQYAEDTGVNAAANAELSEIKAQSKRMWSGRDRSETTYQFQYPRKELDERTTSAPTERERIHKPHPKQYFLTNRLHYVPGYHNADTKLGKSPYLPDGVCGDGEHSYREGIKSKYDGGISDSAVRPYLAKSEDYDVTKWNRTLPPNDTWMAASSSSNGRPHSHMVLRSLDDAIQESAQHQAAEAASHTRYLRLAGAEERAKIHRALDASHSLDKIPNMMIPYQMKGTVGSQRQTDKARVQGNPNKPLYRFPRPRGDFLIHPVWPPSMWHHRIPGFRPDPPANGVLSAYQKHQQGRLGGVY